MFPPPPLPTYSGIAGTIALVTGARQGIGAAVASLLAEAGATVVATDCRSWPEDPAADPPMWRQFMDVTDESSVRDRVTWVEEALGPIDILVNVAGVLRTGPVVESTLDDWEALFAVNARGVYLVSREVTRHMLPRNRGCVVTVASNAAGVPRAGMAAYAASKAASTMLTKSLGLELAPAGIRCNIVAPGSTDTPMQRGMWTDECNEQAVVEGNLSAYRVGIPLGRMAQPADIAHAVLFLASDQARHITMHDLYVDGGATLRA